MPSDDTTIRLLVLDGNAQIGDKRNLGCSRALGEVVAIWDDDDYSAPGRLQDQVGRLLDGGKSVTGYRRMRFTDGAQWWEYRGIPNYVIGTSLCFRRDFWMQNPFPHQNAGEDGYFVRAAAKQRELDAADDAGELMYATVHAGNTCPRQLSGSQWRKLT